MSSRAVCVDENLTVTTDGLLRLAPWSVPRNLVDVMMRSGGDGGIGATTALPGKLLIDHQDSWVNDTPVDHMVLIRVTRASKFIVTSNPNAVQFRDRWSWAQDAPASEPVVTGYFNSKCGLSADVGTNSVAEPNPGKFWGWFPATSSDEWVGTISPGQTLNVWYRMYVWTPPPWSDNANKNTPVHIANAGWARLQLIGFPQQGNLVHEVVGPGA
jgi:hypothetical protein